MMQAHLMRPIRGTWWIGCLALLLVAMNTLIPARAASMLIDVSSPTNLILPAMQVPADFVWLAAKSGPITDTTLSQLAGSATLRVFHHHGWVSGYHGWLDGKATDGAPFATYDLYGFATDMGARLSRATYESTVLGTPLQYPNAALPKSATVWTATGTFGNNQSFFAAEIIFRVANVLADVTGFYVGATAQAANSALEEATAVTIACTHYLSRHLPAQGKSLLPVPLVALPPILGRMRRRARGESV